MFERYEAHLPLIGALKGRLTFCNGMVERLLPAEDPVLESVLKWTVERDAKDVRRLLNGYQKPARAVNGRPC